jgi:hypothetical protein
VRSAVLSKEFAAFRRIASQTPRAIMANCALMLKILPKMGKYVKREITENK